MKRMLLLLALPFLHVVSGAVVPAFSSCEGQPARIEDYVNHAGRLMRNHVIPFWHSKVDFDRGGYNIQQGSRHVVEQARMVWFFSTLMLKGFGHENPTNRQSADAGVNFLLSHFLDKEYGGYYWSTNEGGNAIDDRKFAYGQSFVMFALSRYVRATGDSRAKNAALDVFRTFQLKSMNTAISSTAKLEHFNRDWTPITVGSGTLGVYGRMTGNFVVHLVESLMELYRATVDPDVRTELQYLLTVHAPRFYPHNPAEAIKMSDLQGNKIESGANDYGHLIEYAWLRMEAETSIGISPDWSFLHRYTDYVVQRLNQESGGVPTSTFLEWWPQSELLSAISVAKSAGRMTTSENVLKKLLNLIFCKFVDPNSGIMYYSLNFDGSVRDSRLALDWKVGYHSTRGLMKFIEAF